MRLVSINFSSITSVSLSLFRKVVLWEVFFLVGYKVSVLFGGIFVGGGGGGGGIFRGAFFPGRFFQAGLFEGLGIFALRGLEPRMS